MILDTLGASVLENLLSGKGLYRAGEELYRSYGNGMYRAGSGDYEKKKIIIGEKECIKLEKELKKKL